MGRAKHEILVERRGDLLAIDIGGHETYTIGLEYLFYRHAFLTEKYEMQPGNRPPEDFPLHCWDLARERAAKYIARMDKQP